jgi:putative FmdB family regulatory protein
MPTYQYECKKCGLEFEEIHKINERKSPCVIQPNPKCKVYITQSQCNIAECMVEIVPQLPSMISMRDGWRKHTDDGWKDTLKEIKKNNPGSTLDV